MKLTHCYLVVLFSLLHTLCLAAKVCADGSECLNSGDPCGDGSICSVQEDIIASPTSLGPDNFTTSTTAEGIATPTDIETTPTSIETPTEGTPTVETSSVELTETSPPASEPTSEVTTELTSVPTSELSSESTSEPSSTTESSTEEETGTDLGGLPLETAITSPTRSNELDYPAPAYNAEEGLTIMALDLDSYADSLVDDAQSGQSERLVLPSCPDSQQASAAKRDIGDKLFGGRPTPPPQYNCAPKSLTIDVHFKVVWDRTLKQTEKNYVNARIKKQMTFMTTIYSPYFIVFNFNQNIDYKVDAGFTYNYASATDRAYRQKTRVPGADVLTVWIVRSVNDGDTNGYSYLPAYRAFDHDGVVLAYDRLPLRNEAEEMESAKVDMAAARGGSLVHEFGHWMGLPHVFGDEDETDCDKGDGIEDTYLYSHDDRKWDCFQQVCGSSINLRVNYWMSYSECRGTLPTDNVSIDYRSFTKGQKANMYSHYLTFRKGWRCHAASNVKRSPEQLAPALRKREESKATVLADFLLNNCSMAIGDIFAEDSIPLQQEVILSYSAAASSYRINPPPETNGPRPSAKAIPMETGSVAPFERTAGFSSPAGGATATASDGTSKPSETGGGSDSSANALGGGIGWVNVLAVSLFVVAI